MELTQEEVQKLFDYNFITGIFSWKVSVKGTKGNGKKAGTITHAGYDDVCIRGKKYGLHRIAFLYMEGAVPANVDHVNNIKSCNAWHNLREASISQNSFNCAGRGTKSGYKNVIYDPRGRKKWTASIIVKKKRISLGYFMTPEEANEAAIEARNKHHGEFARHVAHLPSQP
jgi:hypothetical protein